MITIITIIIIFRNMKPTGLWKTCTLIFLYYFTTIIKTQILGLKAVQKFV